MPSKANSKPTVDTVKDDVQYTVKIKVPVMRGHRKYLPRNVHIFTGSVIKQIAAEYGAEVFDDISA